MLCLAKGDGSLLELDFCWAIKYNIFGGRGILAISSTGSFAGAIGFLMPKMRLLSPGSVVEFFFGIISLF